MTILLLGAAGQVGTELQRRLDGIDETVRATRSGKMSNGRECALADLGDPSSLAKILDDVAPQIIVNAAAYTAVDRAESEPELADRINHRAVAEVGAWAARRDALVVHYSTDYVFDGQGTKPYRETDATAPLGVYGRSKLAGETALRDSGARHFILRTAWVYAAHGKNFLRTMLRLVGERDELRVVVDQVGSPTSAGLIAATTAGLLTRWLAMNKADAEQVLGTYHLTASSRCSWFDFATEIFAQAHVAGLIKRIPHVVPINSAEYPTPAQRPACSVLDTAKLALVFGLHLPTWQDGLRTVVDELAAQS
ncbi:MAG: dTDP-4-dehydrorhamnose reductase [Dokdonella sp.]